LAAGLLAIGWGLVWRTQAIVVVIGVVLAAVTVIARARRPALAGRLPRQTGGSAGLAGRAAWARGRRKREGIATVRAGRRV
jgi:hypothetical protein